jgi:hypothetical protein
MEDFNRFKAVDDMVASPAMRENMPNYKPPKTYREWVQWNPIANIIGDVARGYGIPSTWGHGERTKTTQDTNSPEDQFIMGTRKAIADLLLRKDKTPAKNLMTTLYSDPTEYARVMEMLPTNQRVELEALHADANFSKLPAVAALGLNLPSNLMMLSPEEVARRSEIEPPLRNAAAHAQDVIRLATLNPEALAKGNFDERLRWFVAHGLIDRQSPALHPGLRAQIDKLIPVPSKTLPSGLPIRPVPLAHFKAVPPAPAETIRAINSYDDKQFIEYARKLFGPIISANNTQLHPFSPGGMAQLKTKEDALREAESLPPELVMKLQKAFTDWQNNSPPEAGSYSINPRTPRAPRQLPGGVSTAQDTKQFNQDTARSVTNALSALEGRTGQTGPARPPARPAVPPNVVQSGLHWYPKP